MREGPREMNMWVPKAGDLVRFKGFSSDMEALAFSLGEVRELEKGKVYEVVEYIQNEEQRALRLREPGKTITVMGKTHSVGKELPFTPSIDFFEPVRDEKDS
ncbi:hypothetical protein C4585_01085 [Candidatus Parcubacteria bacterium]|nr:MAG: hypothetical protein C4585_01085 [Candidatus Parcubacteria bacterium]